MIHKSVITAFAGMTNNKKLFCIIQIIVFTMASLFIFNVAQAKPLVADLSQYRIEIDSRFNGTRLLLFGARNDIGDIVVIVRGPEKNFTVRKKKRVAGIWINSEERNFTDVPTYYTVASSKQFKDMRDTSLFAPLRVGMKETVLPVGDTDTQAFAEALIGQKQADHLYSGSVEKVSFMGESLFKLVLPFPDNIPRGNYSANVYLFNDGHLTGMQSIPIFVEKIGVDAFIYDFAQNHGFAYGFIAVALALGMGWAGTSLIRRI
jgi:uncharacterized protein (TIGR02186 family)